MQPDSRVPASRIFELNEQGVIGKGKYVLYWMIANRRTRWNYSFQRALDWGKTLKKPVLVFEALRSDYRWASDRFHAFVIQGMIDNEARCNAARVTYYPYLERATGDGNGLMRELAKQASLVVTDYFPCFFLPRMTRAVALRAPCRFEAIDSNGILPITAGEKTFTRAHSFRRFLQKVLPDHLSDAPSPDPTKGRKLPAPATIPAAIKKRWKPAKLRDFDDGFEPLKSFDIDHKVGVAPQVGGAVAAEDHVALFLKHGLERYADDRNHPDTDISSRLSPYLHFGHVSAHQVFADVMRHDGWSPDAIAEKPSGSRDGWWGASPEVESFLDELITWREIGYNQCHREKNYDKFESLPEWAQKTLSEHQADRREFVYGLQEFEAATTHDQVWNCAQRQLVRDGRIHNYLRMLWGKKILHWTRSPREALDIMIELNNKYALDGRNPNSYSGIFWVLGRFDRAWGPEREIFGKIRYMTSDSAQRKLRMKQYLRDYAK